MSVVFRPDSEAGVSAVISVIAAGAQLSPGRKAPRSDTTILHAPGLDSCCATWTRGLNVEGLVPPRAREVKINDLLQWFNGILWHICCCTSLIKNRCLTKRRTRYQTTMRQGGASFGAAEALALLVDAESKSDFYYHARPLSLV